MIVVTFRGAPSPLVGNVAGITVSMNAKGPSVSEALYDAVLRFPIEKNSFMFVSPGARISSARIWPIMRRDDFDVAAYVDRIGAVQKGPGVFDGIGRVSTDTLIFRKTDGARRVMERWITRNTETPGRESINLAISIRETGIRFLQLPRTWVWRSDMRSIDSSADPIVEFLDLKNKSAASPEMKIGDLTSPEKKKPEPPKPLGPGVSWVGHLYQYTGYGKANREILFRIANSMSVRIDDSHKEPIYVDEDLRRRLDAHKNVIVNPRAPLLRMMGPDLISTTARHRIVWTMQESSHRVHDDMVKRANQNFDQLWTPTQWNLEVFRDSGVKIPMRVARLGVNPMIYKRVQPIDRKPLPPCRLISTSRRGLTAVPAGFIFLTVGLPGFRKGWDVIADALELTFSRKRNVNLIIALTHSPATWNEKIYKQFANYKTPIWTLEGSFGEHAMADIYCSSDAYVSASRGEGWNLPATEAAACELPVIVPNNTVHPEIFGSDAFFFNGDGEKKYPEGDWISDWYKGMLFTRFGKRSIRKLAEAMTFVLEEGSNVRARTLGVSLRILDRFTWENSVAIAVPRLLEVQPC